MWSREWVHILEIAKLGGKKISDGKFLKYRLTEKIIDELQNYYRNAIMENSGDLNGMRQAIRATFYHRILMNEKRIHALCPPSPNTWKGRSSWHLRQIQP